MERLYIRKNGTTDKRRRYDPFVQRLPARVLRPSKVGGKAGTQECENWCGNAAVADIAGVKYLMEPEPYEEAEEVQTYEDYSGGIGNTGHWFR